MGGVVLGFCQDDQDEVEAAYLIVEREGQEDEWEKLEPCSEEADQIKAALLHSGDPEDEILTLFLFMIRNY